MSRRRILFLQNGPDPQSAKDADARFQAAGLEVAAYWAYDGRFPADLDGFDGAFLSGSPLGAYDDAPFIAREKDLIRELADRRIPTLGVCFGSQILAAALCGEDQVFRRQSCEVGYKWLDRNGATAGDSVAKDLDPRFYMFVWHNDEVYADHADMTILASSDLCPNHVWRYRDLPLWGIQGHPEITRDGAPDWFRSRRARLEADGADVDTLIAEADEAANAKTMLGNFTELVAG